MVFVINHTDMIRCDDDFIVKYPSAWSAKPARMSCLMFLKLFCEIESA